MKKAGIFWTALALLLACVMVFLLTYEGYTLYFASCEQGCPVSYERLITIALCISPLILLSAVLAGICKSREGK